MKALLTGIFVMAVCLSAAGQRKPAGVDDPHVLGDANAKVTIIEFGDYQCPSCRMFWREVEPRLKKEYVDTGKVKLVFADFPIVQIHPEAMLAAMAVEYTTVQDKFYWQYHDKVFREQDDRGRGRDQIQGLRPEEVGQGHRPRDHVIQRMHGLCPLQGRRRQGQGGW